MRALSQPVNLNELTSLLGQVAPTWRGQDRARSLVQPTGFSCLNDVLPGGGWPVGALIELVPTQDGIGEVRLVLPALRQLCRAQRRVAFIHPPFTPDPLALHGKGLPLKFTIWIATKSDADSLWAATQLLREASTGAILLWSTRLQSGDLRKLQLAAESGKSFAFLFRRPKTLGHPSPAALRIELRPARQALVVHIHKSRGGRPCVTTVKMPKIRI